MMNTLRKTIVVATLAVAMAANPASYGQGYRLSDPYGGIGGKGYDRYAPPGGYGSGSFAGPGDVIPGSIPPPGRYPDAPTTEASPTRPYTPPAATRRRTMYPASSPTETTPQGGYARPIKAEPGPGGGLPTALDDRLGMASEKNEAATAELERIASQLANDLDRHEPVPDFVAIRESDRLASIPAIPRHPHRLRREGLLGRGGVRKAVQGRQ